MFIFFASGSFLIHYEWNYNSQIIKAHSFQDIFFES